MTWPDDESPLEKRYRRLLRLLPARYRAVREQEMVDAFVQTAIDDDPDLADFRLVSGWPGWGESLSVVRLALRLRWTDPRRPRRYHVMTAGIRSATLASLVVFAVIAAETLLNQVRLLIAPPPGTEDILSVHSPFSADSNLWLLARGWAFVLWIPCLILAVSGGRVGARWAAWLAVIPAAVTTGTMIAGPVDLWFGLGGVALVVVQVAVVLGLASIASLDAAPVVHRGRWLTLAAVGVLAVLVPQMVALVRPGPRGLSVVGYVVVDSPGLWCGAAVVAAAVLVVRRGRGAHLSSAALLGVAALAVVAALLRASSLPVWIELAHTAGATPYVLVTVIQLAAVFAIAVTAGTLTARRFRALPPAAYGPTAGRTRHIRRDLPAPGDVADHE